MSLKKPQIQRVYVNVKDPVTGERDYVTVYGKTVEEVIAHLGTDTDQQATPDKTACETAA